MAKGIGDFFSGLNLFSGGTFVGISIGSTTIRLVEIKKERKSFRLLKYGSAALPPESIVGKDILNPIAVSETLRRLIKDLKLGNKSVCISISGNSVITKRMTLEVPKFDKKEIQNQVFWEAEQYLPFDPTEVYMDYHLLDYNKVNRLADVILVAAKRSAIDSYINCATDAGLKVQYFDLDFFALQNIFEINYPHAAQDVVALVDLGGSSMKMVVLDHKVPVFTKESSLGGLAITQDIQKHLNVTLQDAEHLKTDSAAGAMPQEVQELIHVGAENFANEIKRNLDLYSASSTGAPVGSIMITGGSALILGLSKMVEERTKLPTQVLNPFSMIHVDPKAFSNDFLEKNVATIGHPLGLAIRASNTSSIKINFSTKKESVFSAADGQAASSGASAASDLRELPLAKMALLGAVIYGGLYASDGQKQEMLAAEEVKLAKVNTKVAALQEKVNALSVLTEQETKLNQDESLLKSKITTIRRLMAGRQDATRMMMVFSESAPENLWLSEVSIQGDQVSLKGGSDDYNLVSQMIKNLSANSMFSGVELKGSEQSGQSGSQSEYKSFDVSATRKGVL